jgi:hypothetical protein
VYCVYLTSYRGNKLPPFYIGSSNLKRVESGYRGSVASRQYAKLWIMCLKTEPEKFNTFIIKKFSNRKEAFEYECSIQEQLGVVQSPMYINKSYARKNGYFGGEQRGELNPMYGKHNSESAKRKISAALQGRKKNPGTIAKMKEARNKRAPYSEKVLLTFKIAGEKRRGSNHVFFGKKRDPAFCEKLRQAKVGKTWWTDGAQNIMALKAPSSNWYPGITRKAKKKNSH